MSENNYSARDASHFTLLIPPECAGLRIDQALARLFPEHSRSRIAAWLKEGRILLDTRAVHPDVRVWGGESVDLTIPADPREAPPAAQAIAVNVVHEDESVLVIDKPAGLVVHPGSGNWNGTLLNALELDSSASTPMLSAGNWATGFFSLRFLPRSNWNRTSRKRIAAAPAHAASRPVPRAPSPRRSNWTRDFASPTSRLN